MTTPALRPRSTRQALAGREFAVGRVARPGPLTVAWRWRYEVPLGAVVSGGTYLLAQAVGWLWASIITGAMAALVILVPPLRAEAAAFLWWIVTPHRVRTGMAQAWIHSRDGKIPIVLRTARTSFGERVHVWCRAGTSAEDFVWGRHLMAAACWAREVRVYRNERFAHVVVLDVIRRNVNRNGQTGQELWPGWGLEEPGWHADGNLPADSLVHEGQVDRTA